MKRLLAVLLLLAGFAPAFGADLPFGGDTLHYLIAESDLVVQGRIERERSAAFGPTEDRYLLFRVAPRSVAKGEWLARSQVSFGVHESVPILGDRPGEVMVFLHRVNAPTARAMLAPAGTDYVAVSGGYGVIDLRPAGRLEAINALIAAGEETARHRIWAETYLTSADMLLQRSSLHLAYDDISEPWAPALLLRAIGSSAVSLENRDLAIEMALEAAPPGALDALRRLAEDRGAPLFLRRSAVRAVRRLPGGEAQIAVWSASGDTELTSAVTAARAEPR